MNDKIKLLLVADTYHPKVDGTLKFMEEFVKRANKDFEISLLVPNFGGEKSSNLTYLDVSKRIAVSGYPAMKFSLKNIKRIKQTIKNADLIFVQGPALISYFSIYYGHKYKKKTIFYTHTIAWELFEKFFPPILNKLFLRIIKRLSIFFYNRCEALFVPYRELREHLKKEGVQTTINIARLGVDIDLFSPTKNKLLSKKTVKLNPNKTIIGYVGRISKEKNTLILLEAFKKLKNQKEFHLLMVGDGPENLIKEFKKTPNCTVTGFVNNVHSYLKAMDIFVMPSLTETTSLATLEAMSSGIAIIATKVGFIKNYLVKNHNGLFFPRNSASVLAMKIEQLVENKELKEKLEINARKTITYSFSWDRSINKINRLLLKHYHK